METMKPKRRKRQYIGPAEKQRFAQLLAAWRGEHSEAALAAIIREYIRPVVEGIQHRHCFRLADEAQVLHDAVVHIAQRLDRLDGKRNWFAWLSTCAMNYLREAWSSQVARIRGAERHMEHLHEQARAHAVPTRTTRHPWSDDDAR